MKQLLFLVALFLPHLALSQTVKPSYCNDFPSEYSAVKGIPNTKRARRTSLPKFATKAVSEYKVQVAILKNSHPADYPFHQKLVARYRPCEEVWVIESRNSYKSKADAEKLKRELVRAGYRGAYITELISFQAI